MTNFSITTTDFKDGEEIPKKHGYKFENKQFQIFILIIFLKKLNLLH